MAFVSIPFKLSCIGVSYEFVGLSGMGGKKESGVREMEGRRWKGECKEMIKG